MRRRTSTPCQGSALTLPAKPEVSWRGAAPSASNHNRHLTHSAHLFAHRLVHAEGAGRLAGDRWRGQKR